MPNAKQEKIKRAVDIIEQHVPEGCVINTKGVKKHWYDFHVGLAYAGIRSAQKGLFGDIGIAYGKPNVVYPWQDTHTTIKFKNSSVRKHIGNHPKVKAILAKTPFAKTFSVETPVATFVDTNDYALDEIKVYQYTGKKLLDSDIKIMLEGCLPIIGTKYDIGQLFQIAYNQIAGYPHEQKWYFLDEGGDQKVCSVGGAAVFTYLRHELEKQGENLPRLFSKLNEAYWDDKDFIKRFYGEAGGKWSVEQVYPANFSYATTHFNKEFILILHMKDGNVLYKRQPIFA